MRTETDIFISGGGIAGLTAAAVLADEGWRVMLVDPAAPPESAASESSDLRSTAFLQPARTLFETCGLWDGLAGYATPLAALRVMDTAGDPPRIVADRTFDSDDVGDQPFGWNIPNWITRKVLVDRLGASTGVDLRIGAGFARAILRDDAALVTLTDGTQVEARLVVGADGRASPVREAAGIDVTVTRYGQKALAFAVTHERPHDAVSTEIYRSGGAFTLVPLPDHEGRPASAVVWMEDGPRAVALAADPDGLAEAAFVRSCGILGRMALATPVRVWPIVTQRAERLTARRCALIAEAGHVLPPIGAQGLNTSLRDVASLGERLRGVEDPGAPAPIAAYAADRARDVRLRAAAIDIFNRVCRTEAGPLRSLRALGLRAAHDIAPLRHRLMMAGLGR